MTSSSDPGWRPALRGGAWIPVPFPLVGARRVIYSADGLTAIRQLWLKFLGVLVMIWIPVLVFSVTSGSETSIDARPVAVGILIGGAVLQLVVPTLFGRMQGETEDEVRGRAQRLLFLRILVAEVPALAGFLGFMATANPAVYLAGWLVAMAGMIGAAPTRRKLERLQLQLSESGSSVDLVTALVNSGISR